MSENSKAVSNALFTFQGHDVEKVETMAKAEDRLLKIQFNADTAAQMR